MLPSQIRDTDGKDAHAYTLEGGSYVQSRGLGAHKTHISLLSVDDLLGITINLLWSRTISTSTHK